ncbi:MAG: hypothetical protein EXR18_00040 [Flavobacteriaceae bacterium]|nr:hypothetical protein [Flavobacteriaceae bacterium]
MRIIDLVLIGFFCVSILSCKKAEEVPYEGVVFLFNEIQPMDDNVIVSIPYRFTGSYINIDSTYLVVSKKDVFYKWIDKNKISFELFETLKDSMKVVQNKMYFQDNTFLEYRKLKDSVEIKEIKYDTIFSISYSQKVSKINRTFVLNTKDSIYWKIRLITFGNKNLKLRDLYSVNDIRRIDSLSKIKSIKLDSTKNLFQLSKKEFRTMLALKYLGFERNYKKVD